MTSIEEHKKKIIEHLEELSAALEIGKEKRSSTIAFHCSACSMQFMELYLHATHKITMGATLKHEWFKRPKPEQKKESLIERHISLDIPQKEEIYECIYQIEEERNSLMYGKPTEKQVIKVIVAFNTLRKIMENLLQNVSVKIT